MGHLSSRSYSEMLYIHLGSTFVSSKKIRRTLSDLRLSAYQTHLLIYAFILTGVLLNLPEDPPKEKKGKKGKKGKKSGKKGGRPSSHKPKKKKKKK